MELQHARTEIHFLRCVLLGFQIPTIFFSVSINSTYLEWIALIIWFYIHYNHAILWSIRLNVERACVVWAIKKGESYFQGESNFANWTLVTKMIGEEMVRKSTHNDVNKLKKNLITEGLFQRITNCCAIHNQKKRTRVLQFMYLCFHSFDVV